MRLFRRHAYWLLLAALLAGLAVGADRQTVRTRVADGFDQPVGKPDAKGYYKSRGFRANYHMGEDWNGEAGGNSDLGKPVYTIANGYVVLARDMRMGWGNIVIVRHVFPEGGQMKTIDSVYAHLNQINVREGQQIVRGQQVGTIGTAHGQYPAHLHFEIRKNLAIGFNQRGFPRDLSSYYIPSSFIALHRKVGGGGTAMIEIDTFVNAPSGPAASPAKPVIITPPKPEGPTKFRVNRFDDVFSSGR